jgi:hypothetical protein
MGRTFILLKGGKSDTHHEVFDYVRNEAYKEYVKCDNSLVKWINPIGFRGRYDTIDERIYNRLSNSDLVLKTLGKEIEGLYFHKEGVSTFGSEEVKSLHGLIRADVYGLLTIFNEKFFWDLTHCTDKLYPINFETTMFYKSFSLIASQPQQNKNSPFQIIINNAPEGTAVIRKNPSVSFERADVKIYPLKPKEYEEYYSFGECPNEPWNLFPDISKIMKDIEFEKAKKSAIDKEKKD